MISGLLVCSLSVEGNNRTCEGCSLILVIDSFSPTPASIPEENYLVVIDRFFAILKSPNHFKIKQLIMTNCVSEEGHLYDTAYTHFSTSGSPKRQYNQV